MCGVEQRLAIMGLRHHSAAASPIGWHRINVEDTGAAAHGESLERR